MRKRKQIINYDRIINKRVIIFLIITLVLFFIVLVKLINVMVIEKDKYKKELDNLTYSRVLGTSSPRGRIYDRNYNIIVDNKSLKTITYQKIKGTSNLEMVEVAKKVVNHLNLDYDKLTKRSKKEYLCVIDKKYCDSLVTQKEIDKVSQKKLTATELQELKYERIPDEKLVFSEEENKVAHLYYLMNKGYTYEEKIIKSDATNEEYAYISENNVELMGFKTKLDWERVYPYGDVFKTILGKVSTSTQGLPAEEKDYYLEKGYNLNDRVGISYIEKQYEEYLRGEKAVYEVVNTYETKLVKEGRRGKDIVLSIDINLQREVERILAEQIINAKSEPNTEFYDHSSVIIQDPNTGEILAMSGKKYVNGTIVDDTPSLLTSPITPGSVVKGASMLVGYNTGAIHIGERLLDECIKVTGVAEKCSYRTLGVIDDITALAKSSNVYQFKVAIRVNGQEYFRNMKMNFNQGAFDIYRKMYHSFGLGVKTQIDLPVESLGYTSKDRAAGNLLDFVMGQYETYTPIQLSQYITTIANGGERLQPHFLKEVHSSSDNDEIGELEFKVEKKVLNTIETRHEYMQRVREGFIAVLNSPGGYGVGYMNTNMKPAGKTGTSQSFIDIDGNGVIDTETITSSFLGYAPYDNPKMSIMVTSPDSSRPNTNIDYASLVTYRITQRVTEKYSEMYGY